MGVRQEPINDTGCFCCNPIVFFFNCCIAFARIRGDGHNPNNSQKQMGPVLLILCGLIEMCSPGKGIVSETYQANIF